MLSLHKQQGSEENLPLVTKDSSRNDSPSAPVAENVCTLIEVNSLARDDTDGRHMGPVVGRHSADSNQVAAVHFAFLPMRHPYAEFWLGMWSKD